MGMYTSQSVADTLSLGETWGREAQAGWIIGLSGELGAGKTQLAKGIARGLGIRQAIQSPTFTLVNEYTTGRVPMFHLDLYRLETAAQLLGAGLEGYLYEPAGVTVVEWFDRCDAWVAAGTLRPPGPRLRKVIIESARLDRPSGHEPNAEAGTPRHSVRPSAQRADPTLFRMEELAEPQRLIRYEDSGA